MGFLLRMVVEEARSAVSRIPLWGARGGPPRAWGRVAQALPVFGTKALCASWPHCHDHPQRAFCSPFSRTHDLWVDEDMMAFNRLVD